MESKLIPLLIVLALLTGCASTSTSEEAATAPADVPVQTSGPTVTERPYESVSASVASSRARACWWVIPFWGVTVMAVPSRLSWQRR